MKETDRITHLDEEGRPRMVDVSRKERTHRSATAQGSIGFSPGVLDEITGCGTSPKGDFFVTAVVAGIQAAKRTSELIPLCHPLEIGNVDVKLHTEGEKLVVTCTVSGTERTGFEMEALVGATVALLTVYDMAKAVDRSMVVGDVMLTAKTGGKSGDYCRDG